MSSYLRAPRTERHPVTKAVGVVLAAAFVVAAFSPLVDLAQWRFSLLLFAAVALWVCLSGRTGQTWQKVHYPRGSVLGASRLNPIYSESSSQG